MENEVVVYFEQVGENKVALLRIIRELINCGLSEAKQMIDSPNAFIYKGNDIDKANQIKTVLEKEPGVVVRIQNAQDFNYFDEPEPIPAPAIEKSNIVETCIFIIVGILIFIIGFTAHKVLFNLGF